MLFYIYLSSSRFRLQLFLRPLWCTKPAAAALHCAPPPPTLRAQSWFSSQYVCKLQPANHNFPPLTCSACGVVAPATTPSQERRCSISTGLLDLRSHGSLHMAIWEKAVTKKRMPPVLPFAGLHRILLHYAAAAAAARTRCHFSCQRSFGVIYGWNINRKGRSDEMNAGMKRMLRSRWRRTQTR